MVYCGKPSRGCQMCRTRRIKCDETKPTCLQCQKSRRQCPGYKDDFDLVFRNETQATERRARRSVGGGKRVNTQISPDQQNAFSSTANSSPVIAPNSGSGSFALFVPEGFMVPVDEQAPCFFMSNFVLIPHNTTSRGYFDFLLPMMKTESPDSHLSIAFKAVALASLANRPNSKGSGLMQQAIGHYARALKVTNLALQNPVHQKTDQTLASILLLGFFETITSETTNVMAWGSHVEGAAQLVKMRGKKQLRSKIGYSLFIAVRSQMLVQCMSTSRTPVLGTDWWIADPVKDETNASVVKLNLKVIELRAEVNTALSTSLRSPEFVQNILNLMQRSKAMDQEYVAWENSLPYYWRPKTVAWVDDIPGDLAKADICPGKVDMYEDIFIANMWNHARVSRLLLAGMIIRCASWICSPVDYRTTPEYVNSARESLHTITDIVASVPYHLGWRVNENGDLTAGDLSGFACGDDSTNSPKALAGFLCMWPTFSASCSDFATDQQRQWMKGRLNFIGDRMGMNQAKVLSGFQMRLPSMIIYRDVMSRQSAVGQGQNVLLKRFRGAAISTSDASTPPLTPPAPGATPANHIAPPPTNTTPPDSMASSSTTPSSLNPTQQREQTQTEMWEKERNLLIEKARANGVPVETIMETIRAKYLAT